MCGGDILQTLESIALPIIGTAFGGPVGGAIGGGLGSALKGGSIGQDLLGAGLGGLGGELSGSTGSLIPADSFLGGINSGIDSGLSGIGSGISSAFGDVGNFVGNGLGFGSPFGGSSSTTGSALTPDFQQGMQAYAPSSAASSAPGTVASGFAPATSSAGALGGGTSGGFFNGSDAGLGSANSSGGFFGGGTPSAQDAFSVAGSQAMQPIPSAIGGKNMDLTSLLGGGSNSNMINGALRAGLGGLFNQNPYSGSPQIANTLNQSASNYNPYVQSGGQAQTALGNLYGLNGQQAQQGAQQNWQNTPGYQFQLQQGLGALQNSAAARGGLLSGNTAQAINQYGQGLANTTYQQYIDNLQRQAQTGGQAIAPQAGLLGSAAQLQQQPQQYQANQNNQMLGGLFSSLFPSQQQSQGLLNWL